MNLFITLEQRKMLELLAEWRLIDINNFLYLSEESTNANYEVTKKMFQRLRGKGLISTYRDPWTKKSFNYLTTLGEKIISPDLTMNLSEETLNHDSKVAVLCIELLKKINPITSVELEHKFKLSSKKSLADEVVPDAKLFGNFKGIDFLIALELELHQKDKKRLISKAEHYLKSSYYDQAFFFFPDDVLLKRYHNVFFENLGESYNKKIFLFTASLLFKSRGCLTSETGFALNKRQNIFELFGIEKLVPD